MSYTQPRKVKICPKCRDAVANPVFSLAPYGSVCCSCFMAGNKVKVAPKTKYKKHELDRPEGKGLGEWEK